MHESAPKGSYASLALHQKKGYEQQRVGKDSKYYGYLKDRRRLLLFRSVARIRRRIAPSPHQC